MKTLRGVFNQEEVIVGTYTMIVKLKSSRRLVSSSIYDRSTRIFYL